MARRSPFVYRPGWGRSAASVRQREQRQRRQRWLAGQSIWTPAALFAAGEDGLWGEPEPVYLYEDSAGTIADVVDNDPVGLMLDRSRGLELGPELVTNGTFDDGANGWTAEGSNTMQVVSGELEVTLDDATFDGISQSYTLVPGTYYEASAYLRFGTTTSNVTFRPGAAATDQQVLFNTSDGEATKQFIFRATTASTKLRFLTVTTGVTGTFFVDNISVRELPGAHARQATSADRLRYSSTPPNLVPDDVADQLNVTLPAIAAATVAIATPSGADIQYPVDLSSGSYVIDYQNSGVIILDREFTAAETQKVTDYLNARAGV